MEDKIFEKEFWGDLIKSEDYNYLKKIFVDHRDKLNKDCLKAVKEAKFHEAVRCQAKAEDMNKIVDLINFRIRGVN